MDRESRSPRDVLTAVAACVFLSGAASLLLETVWSRLLKLVFGSTTLAITTILVAYMLGLGLGGLFGGRLVSRLRNGVRAYGFMEIGVGIYALAVPWLLDLYPWLNRTVLAGLSFWVAGLLRFVLVMAVLIAPTILMGATLPVLVGALVRGRQAVARRVGLLYGVNTLGAVAGVLGGTFVLFSWLGVRGSNVVGAGLDVVVGLIAILVIAPRLMPATSTQPEHATPPEATEDPPSPAESLAPPQGRRWTFPLISYGLVGCSALVFEVCWTRVLSLVLGTSVYAFAMMLAGFLAGIALGSLVARRWLDRVAAPAVWFASGVGVLGLCALATTLLLRALPAAFLGLVEQRGMSGTALVQVSLATSFLVMLAPTLVLGALFPLAVRSLSSGRRLAGEAVGDVYFVNTIGSASGAFLAGFVLIPWLGTLNTTMAAIGLDLVLGAVLLWRTGARLRLAGSGAFLAGAVAVVLLRPAWDAEELAVGVYYRPEGLLDYGLPRLPLEGVADTEMLFFEEGVNATVSIHRMGGGLEEGGLSMRLNGKTDASIGDMSTQVLSGHIPLLFGGSAEQVLVIGYASGVTTGAVTLYEPEHVDVIEIEPAVIRAAEYFDEVNHRPLERDDVRLILDDGRTWLTSTDVRYDVVISEPSNPWITGCSNLFTEEFFEAVAARLTPEGRLLQWIQLYGMQPEALRSILAALHGSFDHAYGFLFHAESTDLLLVATDREWDFSHLPRFEDAPPAARDDLRRVECHSTADLWSLMVLTPDTLREIADGARHRNSDDTMFVELDAPWHLYDDTPESSAMMLRNAQGVLPLLKGASVPATELGELGLSYGLRRGQSVLAESATRQAERDGSPAHRLAWRWQQGSGDLDTLDRALDPAAPSFTPEWVTARAWLEAERPQRSLQILDSLAAADRERLDAQQLRLQVLQQLGHTTAARDLAESLLKGPAAQSHPELWATVAGLSLAEDDRTRGIAQLRESLTRFPDAPEQWRQLATALQDTDSAAAEQARNNADIARQNQLRLYHRAARWHRNRGRDDEARRTLNAILQMAPNYQPAQDDLDAWRD